eukprot:TRINITY_DN65537_c0_g1_i1.p3 TRINITY_DN65537_c0_g1~~TRINITY_DN65537_c0_g1_i1.p3  ORF type:complete len:123 (-),score=6.58 TRINITY_DN65537_c0_g1_i1:212-580(-)
MAYPVGPRRVEYVIITACDRCRLCCRNDSVTNDQMLRWRESLSSTANDFPSEVTETALIGKEIQAGAAAMASRAEVDEELTQRSCRRAEEGPTSCAQWASSGDRFDRDVWRPSVNGGNENWW